MSKVIAATCEGEVVTAEGKTIAGAEILSEGVESSEGILIIDGDKSYYVANTQPDLKSTIESLAEIIQQVITIATALDAVTVSPGSAAAAIAQLTTLKTTFELTKDNLR